MSTILQNEYARPARWTSTLKEVDIHERVDDRVNESQVTLVVKLPREGIHDNVLQTWDMRDVPHELAYKSQLMPLSVGDWVPCFKESSRQGFLICPDAKTSALEYVPELDYSAVDSQQLQIVGRISRFCPGGSPAEKSEGLKMTAHH